MSKPPEYLPKYKRMRIHFAQAEAERAMEIVKRHPAMHAVWNVLDMDKTLSPTTKNVLWQDFVAAWNRHGLLTNEEADLLIKLRFE